MVLPSVLTLTTQPQASEFTSRSHHERGPRGPSPPASQGSGQDWGSQAGASLAAVGRLAAPKVSDPSLWKCDCATSPGKRDFTDAISKDVRTGVCPESPGRPHRVTKALGNQRQRHLSRRSDDRSRRHCVHRGRREMNVGGLEKLEQPRKGPLPRPCPGRTCALTLALWT